MPRSVSPKHWRKLDLSRSLPARLEYQRDTASPCFAGSALVWAGRPSDCICCESCYLLRMARRSKNWSDENERLLCELWENGLTGGQIAARLSGEITRDMVIGKARRMNLTRRPSPLKGKD